MENYSVYEDIARRTNGDIYIGVVGPVRTGKSTFIKRFMEELVIPSADESARAVMRDELPQSAAGRTVMTTEPKFVPAHAAKISVREGAEASVRLVDCVGFAVEGAGGFEEDGGPRQIKTPWSDSPMPFEQAAALGTEKVIRDHSTIGVLVTTDGSIADISARRISARGGARRFRTQKDRQALRHTSQLPGAGLRVAAPGVPWKKSTRCPSSPSTPRA